MKFRIKIAICMVCLLSLLFGVGGAVLVSATFSINLEQEYLAAQSAYQTVLNGLQLVDEFEGTLASRSVASVIGQLSAQPSMEWSSVRVTYGDEVLYAGGPQAELCRDFRQPLSGEECLIGMLDGAEGHFLQASGAFLTADKQLRLDVVRDCSAAYAARDRQLGIYLCTFIGVLALCAVLSYSLSQMLTKPLTRLAEAAEKIGTGDLSCRTQIRTGDEIGVLAERFDQMAEQVEENVGQLQNAVQRQERFMGMFAHELKTPMTSIIGYADLLRGGTLDSGEQAEAANYIFSEGKRLESLSLKLLKLLVAEGRDLAPVPASPARLAAEVAGHWNPEREKQGIRLTLDCQEGICLLEPDLFQSLVFNLLDNAGKALDGPGEISLRTRMLEDGCVLEVRDSGRGIPEEALRHLTEAFYRVDKSRSRGKGGVGLGLTLCDEIVRLHGGTLAFESQVGSGTCVRATLRGGRP